MKIWKWDDGFESVYVRSKTLEDAKKKLNKVLGLTDGNWSEADRLPKGVPAI